MHHSSKKLCTSKSSKQRRLKQKRLLKKRKALSRTHSSSTSILSVSTSHQYAHQSTNDVVDDKVNNLLKKVKKPKFHQRARDVLHATRALTHSYLSKALSNINVTFNTTKSYASKYNYGSKTGFGLPKTSQHPLFSLFSYQQQQLQQIHTFSSTLISPSTHEITTISPTGLTTFPNTNFHKLQRNYAVRSIFKKTTPARWDKPFNWSATVPPEQPVPIMTQRKIQATEMTIDKLVDTYGTQGVRIYLGISAFSMTVVWFLLHISPTLDPIDLIKYLQDTQAHKLGLFMPKTLNELLKHPIFVEFIFTYIIVRFLHPARVVLAATMSSYFNEKNLFSEVQVANILDQEKDPIVQYERIQQLMHYTRHEYDKHDQYQSLSLKELFDITDIQPIPDLHAFDFVDPRMKTRQVDKHPIDYIGPTASTNQQIRFFNRTGLPIGTLAREGTKPIVKEYADPDEPSRVEYIIVRMTRIDGAEIESIRSTSRNRTSVHIWSPPDEKTDELYQRTDHRFGVNSKLGLRQKAKREFIRRNGKWSILGFNTEHGTVYPEFKAAYEDFWQPIVLPQSFYDQDDVEWYRFHRHPALNFGGEEASVNPIGFSAKQKLLTEQRELQKAQDSLHPFHQLMLQDAMNLASSVNSISRSIIDIENNEPNHPREAALNALRDEKNYKKDPITGRKAKKTAEEIVDSMVPIDPRTGSRSGYIFREDPATHFARESTFTWLENYHEKNIQEKEANPILTAPDGTRIPLVPTEREVAMDKAIGIDTTPREIRRKLQYTHEYFNHAAESDEMVRNQLEFIQYAMDTKEQLLSTEKDLQIDENKEENLSSIKVDHILQNKNKDNIARFNALKSKSSWNTLSRPPLILSESPHQHMAIGGVGDNVNGNQYNRVPPVMSSLNNMSSNDIINSYHNKTLGIHSQPIQDLSHIISSPYPQPIYTTQFHSSSPNNPLSSLVSGQSYPSSSSSPSQQLLHIPHHQPYYEQQTTLSSPLALDLPRVEYPTAPVIIKPILKTTKTNSRTQKQHDQRDVYFSLDDSDKLHENSNVTMVQQNQQQPEEEDENLQEMHRLRLTIDAILQDDLTAAAFDLDHITQSSTPSNFHILAQEQLQVYRQQYEFEKKQFIQKQYAQDPHLAAELQHNLKDMNDEENSMHHQDVIGFNNASHEPSSSTSMPDISANIPQYFNNFADYLREQGRKQINERYLIRKYTEQKQQQEKAKARAKIAKLSNLFDGKPVSKATALELEDEEEDAFKKKQKIASLDEELDRLKQSGDFSDPFVDILLGRSETLASRDPLRKKNDSIIDNYFVTVLSTVPRGKPFVLKDPTIDPVTGLRKSIQTTIDEIHHERFGLKSAMDDIERLEKEFDEAQNSSEDTDDLYSRNRNYQHRLKSIQEKMQKSSLSGVSIAQDKHLSQLLYGDQRPDTTADLSPDGLDQYGKERQLRREHKLMKKSEEVLALTPETRMEHDLKYIRKDLLKLRQVLSLNLGIDQNNTNIDQLRNKPYYAAIPRHNPTDFFYYPDLTKITPLNDNQVDVLYRKQEKLHEKYDRAVFTSILNDFVHTTYPDQLDNLVHSQTFEPTRRQPQLPTQPTGMNYSQSQIPHTNIGGISEYHHKLTSQQNNNQLIQNQLTNAFSATGHPALHGIPNATGPGFQRILEKPLRPSPLAEIIGPMSSTMLTPFQANYFDTLVNPNLGKQTVDELIVENLTSETTLRAEEKVDLRNKEFPTQVPRAVYDRINVFRTHLNKIVQTEYAKYEEDYDRMIDPDAYFMKKAESRAKGEKVSDAEDKDFDEFGHFKEDRKRKMSWDDAKKLGGESDSIQYSLQKYQELLQREEFNRSLSDLNRSKIAAVLKQLDYNPKEPELSLEVLQNVIPEKEVIEYETEESIKRKVSLAPKQTWYNQLASGADIKAQFEKARDNEILDLKRALESGDPPPGAEQYRIFIPGIDDQPYADLWTEKERADRILYKYTQIKEAAQNMIGDLNSTDKKTDIVTAEDAKTAQFLEKLNEEKKLDVYNRLLARFPEASYIFTETAFYAAQGSSGQYSGITQLWKRGEKGHKGDPALPNRTNKDILRDQFEVNWVDDLFDNDVASHQQEWIRLHLKPYINESRDIQHQHQRKLEAISETIPEDVLEAELRQLQLKELYHDSTKHDGQIVYDPKTNRYDYADGSIALRENLLEQEKVDQFFGDGSAEGLNLNIDRKRAVPERVNAVVSTVLNKVQKVQHEFTHFKQFNQPKISKEEERAQIKQLNRDAADTLLQTELLNRSPIVRNIPLEYGTWRHDRDIKATESTLLNFQIHNLRKGMDPNMARQINDVEPSYVAGKRRDNISDTLLKDDAMRFRSSRTDLKDYVNKMNEETIRKQKKLDELYSRNPNPLNIPELGPDGTPNKNKILDDPHEWDLHQTPLERFDKLDPNGSNYDWKNHNNNVNPYKPLTARLEYETLTPIGEVIGRDVDPIRLTLDASHPTWPQDDLQVKRPPYGKDFPWRWDITPDDELMTDDEWIDPDPNPDWIGLNPGQPLLRRPKRVPDFAWVDMSRIEKKYNIYTALRDKYHPRPRPAMPGKPYDLHLETSYFNEQKPIYFDVPDGPSEDTSSGYSMENNDEHIDETLAFVYDKKVWEWWMQTDLPYPKLSLMEDPYQRRLKINPDLPYENNYYEKLEAERPFWTLDIAQLPKPNLPTNRIHEYDHPEYRRFAYRITKMSEIQQMLLFQTMKIFFKNRYVQKGRSGFGVQTALRRDMIEYFLKMRVFQRDMKEWERAQNMIQIREQQSTDPEVKKAREQSDIEDLLFTTDVQPLLPQTQPVKAFDQIYQYP